MFRRLALPLFGLALFLSAALLFNVQPLVGKLLLPRAGGSPEVWNVAVAFFQVTLLLGYLLAHGLGRLRPVHHGLAYLVIVAAAATILPLALPEGWRPQGPPALAIVEVLLATVAWPFLALALGAPTLQRLFAASEHEHARDPYFLYAASNAGSFAGLLLYPLVLEPWFAVPEQAAAWAGAYGLLVVVVGAAVAQAWGDGANHNVRAATPPSPAASWSDRLGWLALAAVPSSLTLGVTTHIATDVAATPLLWSITLGLYLLTFIVAFARRGDGLRRWAVAAQPWVGAAATATALVPVVGTWFGVTFQLFGFAVTALACHALLAARRPSAGKLTEFYLWLSLGGAIGGSFNAFVAPVVFDRTLEYPLALVCAMALNPLRADGSAKVAALVAWVAAAVLGVAIIAGAGGTLVLAWAAVSIVFGALLLAARRPRVGWVVGVGLVAGVVALIHRGDVFVDRNFFGIVRVRDLTLPDGRGVRHVLHGTTVHGAQITSPRGVPVPIGYYFSGSPVAAVFRALAPERVGVVGLASGGMNCFARPGQSFRFYEIDPLMERVARSWFTHLEDCPPPVVQIGDGRLLIEAERPGAFDLIVMDAFASDAIPVHLLTTEAIAMYFDRLVDEGVLLFNISSRYYDFVPVLAANADALGLVVATSATVPPLTERHTAFPSQWAVMARDATTFAPLQEQARWRVVPPDGTRPWTDSYSNPVSALKWTRGALAP